MTTAPDAASAWRGRLYLVIAAVLWSTSGAFTKVLTVPTGLDLHLPTLHAVQIACLRVLFAGLVLVPAVRPRNISFRPLMLFMVVCFALMNSSFVLATAMGTAANAIVLQYTAPIWMYIAGVWLLGEKTDKRSLIALLIGLTGIGVIIVGGWEGEQILIVMIALLSGFLYACVVLCLRVMRDESSEWLTMINHLFGGLLVLPFVLLWLSPSMPSPSQWFVLLIYGTLQMGLPYLLAAKGLKSISPQEAATITLIEPILNPILTYLMSGEVPGVWTLIGGTFILGALAWRYWPRKKKELPAPIDVNPSGSKDGGPSDIEDPN